MRKPPKVIGVLLSVILAAGPSCYAGNDPDIPVIETDADLDASTIVEDDASDELFAAEIEEAVIAEDPEIVAAPVEEDPPELVEWQPADIDLTGEPEWIEEDQTVAEATWGEELENGEVSIFDQVEANMPLPADYTGPEGFCLLGSPLNETAYDTAYRNQLTDRARCLYDDLYSALNMGLLDMVTIDISSYWKDSTFDVVYTETGAFDAKSASYLAAREEFMDDYYAAAGAIIFDHPELFWLHGSHVNITSFYKNATPETATGVTGYLTKIQVAPSQLVYPYANTRCDEFRSEVRKAVDLISSSSSDIDGDGQVNDYEYALAAHDWVCARCVYGSSSYSELLAKAERYEKTRDEAYFPTTYHVVTAAGVFLPDYNGDVVCEGYAKAFKILCDQRGIPCACIGGTTNGEGHMWNAVFLNGEWYITDPTWDDSATISHRYFMINAASAGNRIPNGTIVAGKKAGLVFSYPEISTHKLNDLAYAQATASSPVYSGSLQKPDISVHGLNGLLLREGTDYQVSCDGNTETGEWPYTIAGKNMYSGNKEGTFQITKASIKDCVITTSEAVYNTSNAYKPEVTVMHNGRKLGDADYTISYSCSYQDGYSTLTVTGKGNYTDSQVVTFRVNAQDVTRTAVVRAIPDQTYTGFPIKPEIVITNGNDTIPAANYTYTMTPNTDVGTVTVNITFTGNYCGNTRTSFAIVPAKIANVSMSQKAPLVYNGQTQLPELVLHLGDYTLVKDKDFRYVSDGKADAGRHTLTISGTGNFTGYRTVAYDISPLGMDTITVNPISAVAYDGHPYTPKVSVKAGDVPLSENEYTLAYSRNTNAGTAIVDITFPGTGNVLRGTKRVMFEILPKNARYLTAKLQDTSVPATGSAITPLVMIYDGATQLRYKQDYNVAYANHTEPGEATATVTLKGNYEGEFILPFTITEPQQEDGQDRQDQDQPGEDATKPGTSDKKPADVKPTKENITLKISAKGLKNNTIILKKGQRVRINVDSNRVVKFRTTKKRIASVGKYGLVTAKRKGTCRIRIIAGNKTKSLKIRVKG